MGTPNLHFKKDGCGSSCCGSVEMNPTSTHEDAGSIDPWPRSVGQGSGVAMSCGVGHRLGSDPALIAVAVV